MIAGLACMQLVEQGKLDLDSADQAEQYCPELKAVKILEGFDDEDKPILKEKKNRITLRMLLSHTGGQSHEISWKSYPLMLNSWIRIYLFSRQTPQMGSIYWS